MGKGGGVDTGPMEAAMAQQNAIAQQQLALGKEMWQYGKQRTATYADPALNEFLRIMGFGTTPTAATPAAAPTGGAAANLGIGAAAPWYTDPATGQVWGADQVTLGSQVPGAKYNQPVGPIPGVPGSTETSPGVWTGPQGYGVPWDPNAYYRQSTGPSPGMGMVGETMTPIPGTTEWHKLQAMATGGAGTATGAGAGTGAAGTTSGQRYVSPMESSMFQLPAWTTQQQTKQAKDAILRNVPPGPQQSALLAQVDQQRMQNLGTQAFGRVDQMLNALLGQGGAVWQGAQTAGSQMSAASATTAAAGQMASSIASLQAQAQASNNQMLGGIFSAIGTLGGLALGGMGGIGGLLGGAASAGGGAGGSLIGISNAFTPAALGF